MESMEAPIQQPQPVYAKDEIEVPVERCYYEWLILNCHHVIAEQSVRRKKRPGPVSKTDFSNVIHLSDEFIRGQLVQRTSVWQMELQRIGENLCVSLGCVRCLHDNVPGIWTRFDVSILNHDGEVIYAPQRDRLFYSSKNETYFSAHSKCCPNYQFGCWESVLIRMPKLLSNWDKLVHEDKLFLRLHLYIYRDRPKSEAGQFLASWGNYPELPQHFEERVRDSGIHMALSQVWESKEDSDLRFNVGEESVEAHQFVVSVRSPALKQLIQEAKLKPPRQSESSKLELELNIEGVSFPIFNFILKYLYTEDTAEVVWSMDVDFLTDVLKASYKFELKPLAKVCLERLIETMTIDNFDQISWSIYTLAQGEHVSYKKDVKRFLMENQNDLQTSDHFKKMAKENKKWFLELCFESIEPYQDNSFLY